MGQHWGEITCFSAGMGSGTGRRGSGGAALGELGCWPVWLPAGGRAGGGEARWFPGPAGCSDEIQGQREATHVHTLSSLEVPFGGNRVARSRSRLLWEGWNLRHRAQAFGFSWTHKAHLCSTFFLCAFSHLNGHCQWSHDSHSTRSLFPRPD